MAFYTPRLDLDFNVFHLQQQGPDFLGWTGVVPKDPASVTVWNGDVFRPSSEEITSGICWPPKVPPVAKLE